MIHVRATVKGEPDVLAFTRIYEYGTADEEIFFSSVSMIEEKLRCKMKINVNEVLVLFSSQLVKSVRAGNHTEAIKNYAAKLLSSDKVMIGVPETLQQVAFEAKIDSKPAIRFVLENAIPTNGQSLAG
ncbi:MAG TPA: urease subunit gamma [Nitrososphaera sp.]|nr:urease subunit gamma [Nitrososphaera sp.]